MFTIGGIAELLVYLGLVGLYFIVMVYLFEVLSSFCVLDVCGKLLEYQYSKGENNNISADSTWLFKIIQGR